MSETKRKINRYVEDPRGGLDDDFATIEIGGDTQDMPAGQPSQARAETIITSREMNPKRHVYSSMRRIAGPFMTQIYNRSDIFYKQAVFMQDFVDIADSIMDYEAYYPCYQDMSFEQLRSYFHWRKLFRSGEILTVSVSYIFVYLYELINCIGVAQPEEALASMVKVWKAYRDQYEEIDRYVIPWFKDFHVIYRLEGQFKDFCEAEALGHAYPLVFMDTTDSKISFDIFSRYSSYSIEKSRFYSDENKNLIQECFHHILSLLRETVRPFGIEFEDVLFFNDGQSSPWIPFARALYIPDAERSYHSVALSKYEQYEYKRGIWFHQRRILSEQGKQLIGYILKEMEIELRAREGFKYKLRNNLNQLNPHLLERFSSYDIQLESFVRQAVTDYYRILSYQEVVVEVSNLKRIRVEAEDIQEKLIVEGPADLQGENDQTNGGQEANTEPVRYEPAQQAGSTSEAESIWSKFWNGMTDLEQEAVRFLLHGGSLLKFSNQHFILPEILMDSINDKALEHIGDAVLELDDDAVIYEDYIENLRETAGSL